MRGKIMSTDGDRQTDWKTDLQTDRRTGWNQYTPKLRLRGGGGFFFFFFSFFFNFKTLEKTEKSEGFRNLSWSTGGHCVYLDVYTHRFHSAFLGRFRDRHQDEEWIGRGMPSAIVLWTYKNRPNQHRNHNLNKTQVRGPKLNYPLAAQLTLVIKSKLTIVSCQFVWYWIKVSNTNLK